MTTTATDHTAAIVTAFVAHNPILPSDVPALIASTFAAVSALGQPVDPIVPAPEPAVSVKASVKPDHLVCLCCGTKGKMLKRHLMTAHGLTPEAYRAKWGLDANYPMVAANYADKRRELALSIGLGRKPGTKASSRKKAA
jgi:predicted transcriptional regulator